MFDFNLFSYKKCLIRHIYQIIEIFLDGKVDNLVQRNLVRLMLYRLIYVDSGRKVRVFPLIFQVV